ncbi:MAG: response regulator [Nitrospinota bacterium]
MNSILVVDDNKTARLVLQHYLEEFQYRVYLAESGMEALNILNCNTIDLILLDQVMPGMDGLETFEKIKEEIYPVPPVIMGTSLDSTHLAVNAMRLGVTDFILKPFDKDVLKIKVERALSESFEEKRKELALKSVHRCSLKNYVNTEAMLNDALLAATVFMGMETAFFGKTSDGSVKIEHCAGCGKNFTAGGVFAMEDIFYPDAIKAAIPLFIADTTHSSEWKEHPIHRQFGFASYIGIPILIKGELYGIFGICSTSTQKFDDFTLEITRLFAEKIEREIEKKIIQRELLEAKTLSSMSRMAATIAHEMRQPLTAADVDLAEIRDALKNDPEGGELVVSVRSKIADALQIIRSMMKIYRGRPNREPVNIDINQEINDALSLFGNKSRGVEIVRKFEDAVRVKTAGNLSRIFVNLIGNALDALQNSGKLELSTQKTNDGALITIEDNGTGIPQELLKEIFEPEFSTKKSGEGTGLGLWIAKQETERIGGKIEVESEPGKYTRFRVLLPNFEKTE